MTPTRPPVLVPLTTAVARQWVRVNHVEGGRSVAGRLAHLGVLPGQRMRMIRPSRGGPVLIEVKGSRLALGHALAARISVRLLTGAAAE